MHSRAGLAWLLGQQREREKKGWADRRGGELGRPGARAGWNEREKEWARARRGRRRASWAAGRNGGRFGPRGRKRKFSIYEQGKLREIQIYIYMETDSKEYDRDSRVYWKGAREESKGVLKITPMEKVEKGFA